MKETTVRITYKAFAEFITRDDVEAVTEVTVRFKCDEAHTDEFILERVFRDTNTYSGGLWALIEPLLPPRRTHTAVSVGDEVSINGTTYRCDSVGWTALAGEAR